MKKLTLSLLLLGSSLFATSSEELFNQKCSMCHVTTPHQDMSTLVAPPVFGVMRHVKMSYPSKEKALVFMNDYVMNPSQDKAVCMPQKIKRFGLMPSQKENVSTEELEKITSWMYDNFPPKDFKGGRGMKRAR
jgi:cytochrome c